MANGVANDDIRVMGPTISVRYAVIHNSNGSETIDRQRIDGFTGNIAINGRFKEFSTLGKAISDGVKLGAAVAGPNFALSTSSASEKLASLSVDATKQALANAKAMIEATGRKAGRVLAIHAENGGLQPLNDAPMRAMAMAVPTPDIQIPVNPGRASLSKSVTVTVEILDR
jgi:uncharacterized protein YggE